MQVGQRLRTLLSDVELEVQKVVDEAGQWVELGGEQGTPVQAVADGVVEHVGGPEDRILVRAADGTVYHYGHVEAPNVHEQQTVTAGRTLGQIALDPGQRAHVKFAVVSPTGPVDPTAHLTPPPDEAAPAEPAEGSVTISPDTRTVGSDTGVQVELPPAPAVEEPLPEGALGQAALEDQAAALRAAGWTVEPPGPPAQ
jgi:Peptidase family M23